MDFRDVCDIVVAQELYPLLSTDDLINLTFTCRHFYRLTFQYQKHKCSTCRENHRVCIQRECCMCKTPICAATGWYQETTEGTVKRRRIEKRIYACLKCVTCKTCHNTINPSSQDGAIRCNVCHTRECTNCRNIRSYEWCCKHFYHCDTCRTPPCGVVNRYHCSKCHEEKCIPIINKKRDIPQCQSEDCSLFITGACDHCQKTVCDNHLRSCQKCSRTFCTDCYKLQKSPRFKKWCQDCRAEHRDDHCFVCYSHVPGTRIVCHKCQHVVCFSCVNHMTACRSCREPTCYVCPNHGCQS